VSSEVSIPEEAIHKACDVASVERMIQSTGQPFAVTAMVEDAVRGAAPLIVAENSVTEIPDDVVHAAWHEYVYPLTAVERPMTPGFERAMRVINEWLAGRASVLRGEGQKNG